MATTLNSFLPYLLPYAVGCPHPLARRALAESCEDFARRSLVLEGVDQQDVLQDMGDYDLAVPASCQLVKIKDVMYNGLPLDPTSKEMIRFSPAIVGADSGDAEFKSGTPQKFFQRELAAPTVSLYPAPDTQIIGGLVVRYWYTPLITSRTVPDILFTEYRQLVIDGALSRLLRVKGQAFSDPAEADRRGALYAAAARNAGVTARTGQVATTSRVQPRRFVV